MSGDHEHQWAVTPLLCYVATTYDGPNYRAVHLDICRQCGVLRYPNPKAVADSATWDGPFDVRPESEGMQTEKGGPDGP